MTFFTQISKCSTDTILHHPDSELAGQIHLGRTKIFHAVLISIYLGNSAGLHWRDGYKGSCHVEFITISKISQIWGYVQNMAWSGMAWPLLACQILSFVLCKNVSRDAIETKTHEVLKSWELENKELCLIHHTTGIKRWNFPEHSILFFWYLIHLGPTWFECVSILYITIICWMTQSSINNVTVYQGIMPIYLATPTSQMCASGVED